MAHALLQASASSRFFLSPTAPMSNLTLRVQSTSGARTGPGERVLFKSKKTLYGLLQRMERRIS